MKRKASDLTEKEYMHTIDLLYTAASQVKGRNATKLFLKDLLTQSERIMLGRRIWIARMLISGTPQVEIQKKLKVAPNTIWKVQKWLHDKFPGFENAVKEINKEFEKRSRKYELEYGPFSYRSLKKKYPLHFLLFPEPKKKNSRNKH